jgi:hypothetical protein
MSPLSQVDQNAVRAQFINMKTMVTRLVEETQHYAILSAYPELIPVS